jgi:hypothetical protein
MDCAPAVMNPTRDDTMRIYNQMRCLEAQYPYEPNPTYNAPFRRWESIGDCKHFAMSIELVKRVGLGPGMVSACQAITSIILDTPLVDEPSNESILRVLEKLTFRIFYPDLYDYVVNALDHNALPRSHASKVFSKASKFLYENRTMRISLASEIGLLSVWKEIGSEIACQVRVDSDEDVEKITKLIDSPGKYETVRYVPDCKAEVKYSAREIPQYSQKEVIGEGTYGNVSLVEMDGVGGADYVLKTSKSRTLKDDTLTEISILTSLKHRNVIFIEYIKATLENDVIATGIFMKRYMSDLGTYIRAKRITVRPIMRCILSGVAYIHSQNVIHRDLKPGNILINNPNDVRIADFGMAKYVPSITDVTKYTICTEMYRAPELMVRDKGATYSTAIDMWSVGCIFYELLTREALFEPVRDVTPEKLLKRRFAILGKPTLEEFPLMREFPEFESIPNYKRDSFEDEIPDESARSLLCLLLTYDPMRRITAKQALSHPYMRG